MKLFKLLSTILRPPNKRRAKILRAERRIKDLLVKTRMEVAEEHALHHFSHQHPLGRPIAPSTGNITCDGCSLRILPGKDFYNCKTCSFFLHRICSNMPRKTRHPAHPDHYLTLLVSPPLDNSNFKCEACGDHITGFCYNVTESKIYYHILCSVLPISVITYSHPHALKIEFSPHMTSVAIYARIQVLRVGCIDVAFASLIRILLVPFPIKKQNLCRCLIL